MFCTDGNISVRINLPLFSIVVLFLSCRPFVAITTLSTGLVDVKVTSVSWLGQLTVGERPTGQKQQLFDGKTVENKGKLILTEIFPSVEKHDIF